MLIRPGLESRFPYMKPEKAAEALGITLKVVRTLVVRKILHTYDVWRDSDMWVKRDDVVDLQEKLWGDPSYQKTIAD